jgi:hypothetical protein
MKLAPIILFVYNRPWHTKLTIEALQKNELAKDSELFIFSDAPKNVNAQQNVNEVRQYITSIQGFKKITIIENNINKGLANSIIEGVTNIINQYGKVIVLEDDLISSPYFLTYMNEGLEFYKNNPKVLSITGFNFSSKQIKFPDYYKNDVYTNIRPMSWSWGTWKEQWLNVDWKVTDYKDFISSFKKKKKFNQGGSDLTGMLEAQMSGKLDSWYVRWCYHSYKKEKFTIYPRISLINNIGHDNSGVHCCEDIENIYSHTELSNQHHFLFSKEIKIDMKIIKQFNNVFDLPLKSKIKYFIKKLLGI